MKQKFLNRQKEVEAEFDTLEKERVGITRRLQDIEPQLIQLRAIHQELDKFIKAEK